MSVDTACICFISGSALPLPKPVLGMNCTEDAECRGKDESGNMVQGRCEQTWSLCREVFDVDRRAVADPNRAGFLIKMDYDWLRVEPDVGTRDPEVCTHMIYIH